MLTVLRLSAITRFNSCCHNTSTSSFSVLSKRHTSSSSNSNWVASGLAFKMADEPPEKKRQRQVEEAQLALSSMLPTSYKQAQALPKRITLEHVELLIKNSVSLGVPQGNVLQMCQVYLASKLCSMTGTQLADISYVLFQLGVEADVFQSLILQQALLRKSELTTNEFRKISCAYTHRSPSKLAFMHTVTLVSHSFEKENLQEQV